MVGFFVLLKGGGIVIDFIYRVSYLCVLSWHTNVSKSYIEEGDQHIIYVKIIKSTFETENKFRWVE